MTSYQDLLQQREALEKQIAEARRRENAEAISKARAIVAQYGLSVHDVFPAGRGSRSTRKPIGKVAAKYRDPATGKTWTGRGKAPKWIEGKDRIQFAI